MMRMEKWLIKSKREDWHAKDWFLGIILSVDFIIAHIANISLEVRKNDYPVMDFNITSNIL